MLNIIISDVVLSSDTDYMIFVCLNKKSFTFFKKRQKKNTFLKNEYFCSKYTINRTLLKIFIFLGKSNFKNFVKIAIFMKNQKFFLNHIFWILLRSWMFPCRFLTLRTKFFHFFRKFVSKFQIYSKIKGFENPEFQNTANCGFWTPQLWLKISLRLLYIFK